MSLQSIIISTLIPIYIQLPFNDKSSNSFEIPITLQIPTIILLTLIFNRGVVFRAFTIYLILGLFISPVFHQGGSLGYLLTPNFGYLLGIYPLIKIIDNLNKKHQKINYFDFLRYGILAISSMHLIGIIYSCIQIMYFKQTEILLYNISKYSLGKFGYHLLMLTPITLLISPINKYRYQK